MNPRDVVLNRLRSNLRRKDGGNELANIKRQLANPTSNLIPKRGNPIASERVQRFEELALAAECSIARVSESEDIPIAVANWLAQNNLPTSLVMASNLITPNSILQDLSWSSHPLLSIRTGAPNENDKVSLNMAIAGISETGTLMFTSSPETPTSLSFLPENHIAIIEASNIVGSYEEATERLRGLDSGKYSSQLPRVINLITGPSRTGDIALKLELGAHGPRRLHVVIVGNHL